MALQRSIAPSAHSFALLSVGAALVTIILKASAYWLTGSVGLLSDAVEGVLILVAAVGIGLTAWERLLHLRPLEQVWLGLAISLAAAAVNGAVALILLRASTESI